MDTTVISVDNAALTRLKADFAGYFRDSVPGVPLKWCNGILTKLADGSATYRSTKQGPFAVTIPFTVTNGVEILRKVPVIKKSWEENYPDAFAAEDITIPPVTPPIIDPPSSGKIKWLTTRTEAMAQAKARGLKIFMLAGKNSCSVTQGMRDFICELPDAANPNASPIKALIEQHFIPWWSDIDGAGHIEYEQYAPAGMFNMPLMCVIASNGVLIPMLDSAGLVVKWIVGNKNDVELYTWLMQYV